MYNMVVASFIQYSKERSKKEIGKKIPVSSKVGR